MQQVLRYGSHLGLAFLLAAGLTLAIQPTDTAWWSVRLPGVFAFVFAVAALVLPRSPRKIASHRFLGWLAVAVLGAHILLTAVLEPALWRWLSPAIPLEIIAGLVAAVALFTTLAVRRSQTLRSGLGPPATFGLHRIAGTIACLAAGAHITLVAGMAIGVILLISAGIVVLLAVGFQREKHIPAVIVAIAVITGVVAIFATGPLSEFRLTPLRISPVDHARFSHTDHGGFTCTTCHHNFLDGSGKENCISCHKRLTTVEPMRVDRIFHVFCGDCHSVEKRAGRETGPIDHCLGCHEN